MAEHFWNKLLTLASYLPSFKYKKMSIILTHHLKELLSLMHQNEPYEYWRNKGSFIN